MSAVDDHAGERRPFRVALVNNMPDAAFVDTEEQFRGAMSPDAFPGRLEFEPYTITEISRSEAITAVIEERYLGLDHLWAHPPDALIVTGTEPAQVQLAYEPYWPYLARLLQWAATSVPTTLLSCLAAHASILLFDGIERSQRPAKLSGVFPNQIAAPGSPLVRGLPEIVPVPHSRLNDVSAAAMVAAGYEIVLAAGADGAGWSVAARQHDRSLFVLCQGHPEYSAVSLLREYRRDVRRSVFGRGVVPYPTPPEGYFGPDQMELLDAFAARAAGNTDPKTLWNSFPDEAVAARIAHTWRDASATFYANWLGLAQAAAPAG